MLFPRLMYQPYPRIAKSLILANIVGEISELGLTRCSHSPMLR